MPALTDQERGKIGLDVNVVGGQPRGFAQTGLGALEILDAFEGQRALYPYRWRKIATHASCAGVQRGCFGIAGRAIGEVREVEERVGVLRLACEHFPIAGGRLFGGADGLQCKTEIVQQTTMPGGSAQRPLVAIDRRSVLAALAQAIPDVEQRLGTAWIKLQDALPERFGSGLLAAGKRLFGLLEQRGRAARGPAASHGWCSLQMRSIASAKSRA